MRTSLTNHMSRGQGLGVLDSLFHFFLFSPLFLSFLPSLFFLLRSGSVYSHNCPGQTNKNKNKDTASSQHHWGAELAKRPFPYVRSRGLVFNNQEHRRSSDQQRSSGLTLLPFWALSSRFPTWFPILDRRAPQQLEGKGKVSAWEPGLSVSHTALK